VIIIRVDRVNIVSSSPTVVCGHNVATLSVTERMRYKLRVLWNDAETDKGIRK
jgi:hypothetical protein